MTFAASANCILYMGARPVFADVRSDTLNIDPARVEALLSPKTRALIVVDYTGLPCDLAELQDISRRHNLVLIEDAAHALGATYRGAKIGTQADLTTFSLHPVKHITTGEGGVITTEKPESARRMKAFRNHGITTSAREREAQGAWFYEMAYLGYNYRLTDLQCALGLSQMSRLDEFIQRRREIAARYDRELADLPLTLPARLPDRESAWHLYVVRLDLKALRADRKQIFAALRAENIGVNVHYIPAYWHPYYRDTLGYAGGLCPTAEAEYDRLLSLPVFPKMTDRDVSDVVEALHKVLAYYGR
jgi:perosamine synthetase